MADVTKEQVVDFLSEMSVMDLAALTKELEEKWGVSAAPVAVAGAAPAGAGDAAAAEEKTEFDVILADIGAKKINVIKAVREITSLGQRGKGDGRKRTKGGQRRRIQRRRRDHQKEARRSWRQS